MHDPLLLPKLIHEPLAQRRGILSHANQPAAHGDSRHYNSCLMVRDHTGSNISILDYIHPDIAELLVLDALHVYLGYPDSVKVCSWHLSIMLRYLWLMLLY